MTELEFMHQAQKACRSERLQGLVEAMDAEELKKDMTDLVRFMLSAAIVILAIVVVGWRVT